MKTFNKTPKIIAKKIIPKIILMIIQLQFLRQRQIINKINNDILQREI